MFLNKFFYFLKGYVIIRAEGKNTEQFINMCTASRIHIREPIPAENGAICASVPASEFTRLITVAYRSRCRVRIVRKCTPRAFAAAQKSAAVYFVCALAFPALLVITSQFVWSVEVHGAQDTDTAALLDLLAEHNVRPGVLKRTLPDAAECKNLILRADDRLTWAWVYTEGTKLRIEVREGRKAPPIPDESIPCDIVAARDGIVRSISAENGTAAVKEGDVVCAGDVLIAGTYDTGEFGLYTTHASGGAFADTVHRAHGSYNVKNTVYERTGKKKTRFDIDLFSIKLPLYIRRDDPFDKCEIVTESFEASVGKNYKLGFGLTRTTFYETSAQIVRLTDEYIEAAAREELERRIAKELCPGAERKNSEFRMKHTDSDTVFAELIMEVRENIGVYSPIK